MKTQKNLLTLLVAMLLVLSMYGQDAIDKYFSAYRDDPAFTSIVISSKMFQLFSQLDPGSEEGKQAMQAMQGLNGIKMLANESMNDKGAGFRQALSKMGAEYEQLMSIDEKDEKVRFYIREEGKQIKELVMLVGGGSKLFVMSINGDIDLEKLSSLSKSMNVGGMDYLKNLDDKQKSK